jgi:rRNA processing protein Krr1/Pno1
MSTQLITFDSPLFLGGALTVIILIAFFSNRKEEEEEASSLSKSSSSSKSGALKEKSRSGSTGATAAASLKKKKTKTAVTTPAAPAVVEEEPVEGGKKKKKKGKKKSTTSASTTTPTATTSNSSNQPPEKSVSFATSSADSESEDEIDLWVIQSSSKRNKKQTDASKRAAANKEKEREKKVLKQREAEAAAARQQAEAAVAEVQAKEEEKAAIAAVETVKKVEWVEEKKTNGSSSSSAPAPSTATPAVTPSNGESSSGGDKKKRKRKKKKPVDNDDGEPKAKPVAPPVTHWETVPVVEEWQEVTHKSSKKKESEPATTNAASAAAPSVIPDSIEQEEPSSTEETTPSQPEEISTTIPAGDDPLIFIGKGGATIKSLQETSGAKFHLDRTANTLTITGMEDAVQKGLAEAQSILDAEAQRKANEMVEKVNWGSDAIKAVIGKGGSNIRSAQEATGVKIDADVEAGTLVITGPKEMVSAALTLCHNAAFGEAQRVIELGSRNAVNVVYGPNFSTIREMQEETGCKLDIARGGTKLKLSGSVEAVAAASARVRALLDANQGFEMTIENSKVGAVYGKGGETLRAIQDRTGVQIDVVRGPTHATVSVMGTKEASEKARRSLQRAIDGEIELAPGEVAEEIALGSATAAVIGRGGSNVTDMEKRHGVKINVRSDEQAARVVGKPEKVAKATKDIMAIVKPILDAEKAQKEANQAMATGDSAWQVDVVEDDADGW